ncbi:helix-turn-helix transcriptional regulator [Streptomyces sp. MMG1121]|uniref:helix-turn-helix transcriptional regulator n=1 Tax=Streptomyces sp. MMG1121 TaxID=1415544 RepID=UPI0006BEC4BD|nr:LuxR family transcriptional regulator [Streptomyces sp. MMG1121]KOV61149.1 hypothetical protein ADK64_28555 [Streptomyces sp. MMG1121]
MINGIARLRRSVRLVERGNELTQLRDLLATCLRGTGGVALVTGAVASGKTSLMGTFAQHVAESGALFLHASASKAEQGLPLGVVGQLLHTAPLSARQSRRSTELVDEYAEAAELPDVAYETIRQDHVRVIHDLCTLLLELATHGPVVIGIDDVEYADRLSLQFLSYLARRLTSAPVLIVLTERAVLEPGHPSFHTELLGQTHCLRIRLEPLTTEGIAELLADHLDTWDAGLPSVCAAISGGNPLLVRALIDDHQAASRRVPGQRMVQPPVGEAFREAVLVCVHRCGPGVLDGARGLAVLDEPGTPALLGQLLGIEAHRAAQIMDVLNAAGLLEQGGFRHPAARSAVLDNFAGEERAELHRRAAELLYPEGAPAMTVAAHLVAADRVGAPWAVPVLQEAADQALTEDRVDEAVAFLKLAHRTCADARSRAMIMAALADAEWRINPSAVVRQLPQMTSAIQDGHLQDTDALAPISYLLWDGRIDEATRALRLLDESTAATKPQTVSDLYAFRLSMAASYPALLTNVPELPPLSHRKEQSRESLTMDMRLRAVTAFTAVLRHDSAAEAVTAAEHVLQSCHLGHTTLEPMCLALLTLVYADRLDKATPWCDALLKEADHRHSPTWQATLTAIRADIALRQGDLTAAEVHARTALDSMSERSWGVAIGAPLATLLHATTAMGQYAEAEALTRSVPPAVFQTRWGLSYLHARGRHYLATERPQAALSDFVTCGELMVGWDMDLPALVPWRSEAARVHLQLGDVTQARRLAEEQLARPGTRRSRTHGIALRTLASCSEPKQRPQILRKAAEELQECGDRFELAGALADLSDAHHALGESDRARMMARRAWHVATDCKAGSLLQRWSLNQAAALPEPPAATEGLTSLSDAERRVAALAVKGHTNREIARKLYITVSTVEQHLTRAYRKLDVRNRADLPVRLQPSSVAPA